MPENVYIGYPLFAGHFAHIVSFQQNFLSISLDVLLFFPCLWSVTEPCFFLFIFQSLQVRLAHSKCTGQTQWTKPWHYLARGRGFMKLQLF